MGGSKTSTCINSKTLRKALEDASIPANYPDIIPVLGTSYGHHLDSPDTLSLSEWSTQAVKAVGCIKPPVTVSTACSAGSDAILTGLNFIKAGLTEICVCGERIFSRKGNDLAIRV